MEEPSPDQESRGGGFARRLKRVRKSRSALILLIVTVVTSLLGFLREAVFAYFFGTSIEMDLFLVALTLPKVIVMQVATVSISVMLPLYVGHLELQETAQASRVAQRWMIALGGVLVCFCLLLGLFPRAAVSLIAPGLEADQEILAAIWLRRLLPYVLIGGLGAALKVVLDSHKAYQYPAAGNGLIIIGTIVTCLVAAHEYGVSALPWGFGIGAAASFALQWWEARKKEPRLGTIGVRLEELLQLPWAPLGWVFLQTMTTQLYNIFDRAFASTLPPGNISAINYAKAAMAAPLSMSTSVLATVLFPVLAAMAARQDWRGAFSKTARWVGLIVVLGGLGAVLLYVFRVQFVDLLFGRGAFNEESVAITASIVGVLAFTIITGGCSPVLNRLLLSYQLFRVVAILAIVTAGVKLLLNFLLIGPYGVVGLALGTLGAATVGTVARFLIAWRVAYTRGRH